MRNAALCDSNSIWLDYQWCAGTFGATMRYTRCGYGRSGRQCAPEGMLYFVGNGHYGRAVICQIAYRGLI